MIVSISAALLGGAKLKGGAQSQNSGQDIMNSELDRLGKHTYSDEGIPMFLACENLGAARSSAASASPTDLNRKVGSAFHQYAAEWHHRHPKAPASDVAKIVEVLASRDFRDGGLEHSL